MTTKIFDIKETDPFPDLERRNDIMKEIAI